MSDLADRAERAHRMASVIEADVLISTVLEPIERAAVALESVLGGHDAARAVRALHDQARVAAAKVAGVRSKTPWP